MWIVCWYLHFPSIISWYPIKAGSTWESRWISFYCNNAKLHFWSQAGRWTCHCYELSSSSQDGRWTYMRTQEEEANKRRNEHTYHCYETELNHAGRWTLLPLLWTTELKLCWKMNMIAMAMNCRAQESDKKAIMHFWTRHHNQDSNPRPYEHKA